MEIFLELIKSLHFVVMTGFFLTFSLWIREEFITIFNRKRVASFSLLKVLIIRAFSENNGLYVDKKNPTSSLILYGATILSGVFPLFFLQMSDRVDLFGTEYFFGLISKDNSWLYFFCFLITGELLRSIYDSSYQKSFLKVLVLISLLLTFLLETPSFSIEQMVQYQKSFNEWGFRNYFLIKNPLGLVFVLILLYSELDSPKSPFTLINHIYLNSYVLLFIYGFLGGYGLPSILEKQNITPGIETALIQNISLIAKFVFCIIIVWVMKYSFIKLEKGLRLND